MDAKSVVKSYLKPAKYMPIVTLIVLLLSIALFAGAAVRDSEPNPDPVAMVPGLESDVYASLDAIVASDWLASSDDNIYYALVDTAGNVVVAKLSDAEFRSLKTLNDYYNDPNPNAPVPAPITVTGVTYTVGSSIAELLRQSFDLNSTEEYYEMFGRTYLNVGSTPSSDASAGYLVGGVFLAMFALIFGVVWLSRSGLARKAIAKLEAEGELENAANELENGQNVVYPKQNTVLTDRFLFSKGCGSVVRYEDILWCYKRVQRSYFVPVAEMLMACTVDNKTLQVMTGPAGKKSTGAIEQVMEIIAERNPNVLLGYTADNNRMYRDWVREAKANSGR